MPVSHSHQFLWVPVRFPMMGLFPETVRTGSGLLGSVTSQTSCAELANPRSMYTLLSRIGSVPPSHTRTNWAPPLVGVAGGVTGVPTGMWTRNFGRRGSETSRIEEPFGSFLPVIRLNDGSCCPVTGVGPNAGWPTKRIHRWIEERWTVGW